MSEATQQLVFTIGHSTHPLERFVVLLTQHGVTAVGDVRSRPYSRISPQFNRETLKEDLRAIGITYVFLGDELGARSDDPSCYENGRVRYDRLALSPKFQAGLDRVRAGMKTFRLALMCAEKDPLECHRALLVGRQLSSLGVSVQHIRADGVLESHAETVNRLLRKLSLSETDLFRSREEVLDDAYKIQEGRIAYRPTLEEAASTAEGKPA
jgi:uncharacterized protein (DUF488 family)